MWLEGDLAEMPRLGANIVRMVAAILIMLAALVLSGSSASAHGVGHVHGLPGHANLHAAMTIAHPATPDPGCAGCLDCCFLGQCTTSSAALPGSPDLLPFQGSVLGAYHGVPRHARNGIGTIPAIHPPKLAT